MIKETMDKKFGSSWHVVIGEGFGFEITHEVKNLLYMFFGGSLAICVWKCSWGIQHTRNNLSTSYLLLRMCCYKASLRKESFAGLSIIWGVRISLLNSLGTRGVCNRFACTSDLKFKRRWLVWLLQYICKYILLSLGIVCHTKWRKWTAISLLFLCPDPQRLL